MSEQLFNQSLAHIKTKYQIVGQPYLLSRFYNSNGKTSLSDFVQKNYKETFAHNERIVVLQDCDDIYDYEITPDSPGQALIYLQEKLQEFDISNNFVLLVTGNKDAVKEVKTIQEKYSTDLNCIEVLSANIPYNKVLEKRDTFCVMPWVHLYDATDAQIYPCCYAKFDQPFGNLLEDSVEDIINNENFCNLRSNMLNETKNSVCENCYQLEDNGGFSKRQNANKTYKHLIPDILKQTNSDGSVTDFAPLEILLALNNNCNLKCRTCSGYSSSKLAQEEKTLYNYTDNLIRMINVEERKHVVDAVLPYVGNAKKITFAGGEPTLQVEQYCILDKLLETNKTSTDLNYNINCTNLGVGKHNIIEYWKKFSTVNVVASLDGVGDRFEYIRSGASWHEVCKNFTTIQTECPHINLEVNSVLSFISLESVIELQQTWHSNKTLDINKFEIHLMLENAGYFDIQTLPMHHKNRLEQCIIKHCNWLNKENAINLENDWRQVIDYMYAQDKTHILKKLRKDIQLKDNYRNTNFFNVFPEYADLFDNL